MISFFKNFFHKHRLLVILIIGLIHGLIYIFTVPPWQHYDEMGHFEYAWMIADQGRIPNQGEFDNDLRARMLDSMKENRFFDLQKYSKPLESWADDQYPIWIGITQVGDPPFYYIIVALILRLFMHSSIDFLLYLGRLVSLIFFEGILVVAYYFAKELFFKDNVFSLLFPLSLALFPAFVDNMTALNNDVAGVFFVSLVIFYGVKIINNRELKSVIIFIILTALLFVVKVSVWVVAIPSFLLFLSIFVKKVNKWSYIVVLLMVVGGAIFLFDFDDAAFWYRKTIQTQPTSVNSDLGSALLIANDSNQTNNALYQTIPVKQTQVLEGQVVTLGAWVWSDQETNLLPPSVMVFDLQYQQHLIQPDYSVVVSSDKTFVSTHYKIPNDINRIAVVFHSSDESDSKIYYQNPILVLGEYPNNIPPIYLTGSKYDWNGSEITNFVRNDLLNQHWPRFSPIALNLFNKIDYRISEAANWIIYILDIPGGGWYTKFSIENVFRTFWGKFGWGHVLLLGKKPYWYPLIFSLIGIFVASFYSFKKLNFKKMHLILWLGLIFLSLSFFAWFSGVSMQSYFGPIILPGARFIYPGIFIVMTVIIKGWCLLIDNLKQKINWYFLFLLIIFYCYLNINSYLTVYKYFY